MQFTLRLCVANLHPRVHATILRLVRVQLQLLKRRVQLINQVLKGLLIHNLLLTGSIGRSDHFQLLNLYFYPKSTILKYYNQIKSRL